MPSELTPSGIAKDDQDRIVQSGIDFNLENRCGSYLQMDQDVVQSECRQEGIEVLSFKKAMEMHPWLKDYLWKAVSKDKDEITKYVAEQPDPKGYVIIAHKGTKNILPVQACLYLGRETIQHVHNIIIAEEGAELHMISGCASGGHVGSGAKHYGVSEFYIKKDAKVSFTYDPYLERERRGLPAERIHRRGEWSLPLELCLHAAGKKGPDVPDCDLKRRELGCPVFHDRDRIPLHRISMSGPGRSLKERVQARSC